MGFTTYIRPAEPAKPSIKDQIALLTGAQKTAILTGFAEDIKPNRLKREMGINVRLIEAINNEIEEIQALCRILMREELELEPAVIDQETGEEITPPVYNDAPETIAELKAEIELNFTDIFTPSQISSVVELMIDYSEIDASGAPIGDAATYAAEVVK